MPRRVRPRLSAGDGTQSYDKLAFVADLSAQYVADELAGRLYFRQGERTVDLLSVTARGNHAGTFQNREMLRYVGGRDLQSGLKIGNRQFALGEQVQHAETSGVCEGFADLHLHLEDLIVDLAFCSFRHHCSHLHCITIRQYFDLSIRNCGLRRPRRFQSPSVGIGVSWPPVMARKWLKRLGSMAA